jgi:hypothetical protein
MTAHQDPEPGVAFVRLSQSEVGEVDAQLRPAIEAIERVGGYVPAIEQGMSVEEIREAVRQDIAQALSSKPRRRWGEPIPGVIWELESASKRNKLREGFERCLGHVEDGRYKIIGIFDADRLTRDPDLDNRRIIGLGEQKGLVIASDSGDYHLDRRADRTKWRDQTNGARDFVERLRDKELVWHGELAAKGGYHGGQPPFGFRCVPAVGKRGKPGYRPRTLEVDEDELPRAKQAITDALAGRSLRAISLANQDMRTLRSTQALRRWLTDPAIAGWRAHCGEIVRQENGEPMQAWPGIASADEYWLLVARFPTGQPETGQPRTGSKYLLGGGRLRCPYCGHSYVGYRAADGRLRYHCPPPPAGCNKSGCQIPKVDRFAYDLVADVIEADAFARKTLASAGQENARELDLKNRRGHLERQKARYRADYEAGPENDGIDRHTFASLTAKANAELAKIEQEEALLLGSRRQDRTSQHTIEEIRQGFGIAKDQDPARRWRLPDRQDWIDTVLDYIEPQPGRAGPHFDPSKYVPHWQEGVDKDQADAVWQDLAARWNAKPPCPVEGCERLCEHRDYCGKHYRQRLRYGQPMPETVKQCALPGCQVTFEPKRHDQRYCSPRHRRLNRVTR